MAARGGVQRGHGLCFERYFERNIFGIIFVVLRFRRSASRSSDQTSRAIETDGDGLASDSSGARHGLSASHFTTALFRPEARRAPIRLVLTHVTHRMRARA